MAKCETFLFVVKSYKKKFGEGARFFSILNTAALAGVAGEAGCARIFFGCLRRVLAGRAVGRQRHLFRLPPAGPGRTGSRQGETRAPRDPPPWQGPPEA